MTGSRGRPVVVVDPTSASAATVDEFRSALAAAVGTAQVDWVDVGEPTDDDVEHGASEFARGRRAADRAAASGAPTVIACGHDTTVRACVDAVAGSSTALGVVSLGGGSLLAANLGIEPGPDAVSDAVSAGVRRIDVGEANGEVFAVSAGFGTEALVGVRGPDEPVTFGGLVSGLRGLVRRLVPVIVHVDGVQRFAGRSACVLVANCADGPGRATVVPGADPTDAELDLAVLAPRRPWRWPGVLWRLVTGGAQHPDDVLRWRGEWVFVQTWRPRAYELDGDVRPPASRLDVQVWPAALAVRAPVVDRPATTVEESAVEESEIEEPAVAEPAVAEPAVAEPAVEESEIQESTVEEPDVEEPPVEEPDVEESVLQEPAPRKSAARTSTARKPAPRKSAPRKSAPRKSAARKSAARTSTQRGPLATEDSDPPTN